MKSNRFSKQSNNFARATQLWSISVPSLRRSRRESPYATCSEGREHTKTNHVINLLAIAKNSTPGRSPAFDILSYYGITVRDMITVYLRFLPSPIRDSAKLT